jgi:transcriptional regulator with AAA-type ATPase domain/NAD-dependent dihydropyrimidine dehydrogenase PreA subunit
MPQAISPGSPNPGIIQWLAERSELSLLPTPILGAIAAVATHHTITANRRLILEDALPETVYILQQGRLESYRTQPDSPAIASSLLPGSVVHMAELLLDQPARRTIITLSDCELLEISKADFLAIAQTYPELTPIIARQLALDLVEVSAKLAYEQTRQTILAPYRVPKAKRGIVGSSRYAQRLRQQIKTAGREAQSVIIFGEPGLEKDNIAALIHFGSPRRHEPVIQLNCNTLQASGAELFGRGGSTPGLLAAVGPGTLVLNNVQELAPDLFPRLIQVMKLGSYAPVSRDPTVTVMMQTTQARIIMVSEKALPDLEKTVDQVIKIPPLRVRKGDIKAQVNYFLSRSAHSRSQPKRQLTAEALRRLQAYPFPGNIRELESLLERAIAQAPTTIELGDELFWPAEPPKQRFRVNLLNAYPWLRNFLRSDWWPTQINYGLTLSLFAVIVTLLFVGPQDRAHNLGLNLFWAWWWPVVLLGFPFVGRLWCAVCPFMIYGELVQWVSLKLWPRSLRRWPREQADRWGGWFLFVLFALIFLWEELWNLQNTAYLSSCLLLLITAGAIIGSLIFERRFWCRYLCPIGGMNGLYAKLSMTELRAQQGTCAAECTTYQCYKGGPAKGEGQTTAGCPLYSHPAQLLDNRDCVLCMTCLKACPHRSVELNLRPPAIELWTTHQPRSYEVALLLLMLGGVFLHRLAEIETHWQLSLRLEQFGWHALVSIGVLLVAAMLPMLAHLFYKLWNRITGPRRFLELAYGYLPLTLGGTLAHYLRLGLTEAGQILPVSAATFGFSTLALPQWSADPAVIAFLQGTTLVFSIVLSWILLQKISRQSLGRLIPHLIGILGIGILFWQVIV